MAAVAARTGGETQPERFRTVRSQTEQLCAPLSAEDAAIQSMALASPAKWHLAHTTWFFETFLLEPSQAEFRPFHPAYRALFNSYYHSVGPQHPRSQRGLLSRPPLEEVLRYREHVDRAVLELLEAEPGQAVAEIVEVGLHHEAQHQELILTDLKHMLSQNPLRPAYQNAPEPPPADAKPLGWIGFDEGVYEIGHGGAGFAFDNERPRHRVVLRAFELASRPIRNGEYLAFIGDGGYERVELWLSDGWDVSRANGWRAPLYWEERDGRWCVFTLSGLRKLRSEDPVCHVSYYEADAFARWMGQRLASEMEWEVAAAGTPLAGNFLDSGLLHPRAARSADGAAAALFGDVWEWTCSPYSAYPGFVPNPGSLGEYNAKFMVNQMVLRGGSCASPPDHLRVSYRNFLPPDARWQFSGIRLARDAS